MRDAIRVIARDKGQLLPQVILNIIHLMLKGAPFGGLALVVLELVKPAGQRHTAALVMLCLLIVVLLAVNLALAVKVHTRAYLTAYDLTANARLRLADHLRKLCLGFFRQRDFGDISALLLQDMARVESIFSNFFMDAVACVVLPGLMALVFLGVSVKLTLLMLGVTALAVPALVLGQNIIQTLGARLTRTRNRTAAALLEYILGIRVLKAFNLTGAGFLRLDRAMKQLKSDSMRLEVMAGAPLFLYMAILEVGFTAVPVYGICLLGDGQITREALLVFLVAGYKFFEPLVGFGAFISEIRFMNIAAARIAAVMDTRPLPEPSVPVRPRNFDVAFEHVDFSYTGTPVFKDLTVRFPEKSVTALVGLSGSGKTTLTHLVARFWDVDQGAIKIGGTDIKDMDAATLNHQISMVFQDVYLFRDTVRNNIMVGKTGATEQELIRAAEQARCHEFIMALPKGYDTVLDENGANLSGGERQRISIARAILKDAPIILLDEATSSLDPENAHLIQEALNAMVASKTLIVIAHTLNTVKGADQILVLDGHGIAEQGTHGELLAQNGLYRALWQEQQQARGWKFKSGLKPDDPLRSADTPLPHHKKEAK